MVCPLAMAPYPQASVSTRRAVQHLAQPLDLWPQLNRMIADEEAVIVGEVRVRETVDAFVVVVSDHVMARDAAAGDDAIADVGLLERAHDARARQPCLGIEDEGEGEGRALAVLALNDEPVVGCEQLSEQRPVPPPCGRHRGKLLE